MSTPIFKASIPLSNPLFHSLHPVPWTSAVNGISKKEKLLLLSGAQLSPGGNGWNRAGKDAFFISSYNGGVLAIADGVSGAGQLRFPSSLVRKAHAATSSIDSATVIVAMLEGNGMLKFANVGDRGLKLIREGINLDSEMMSKNFLSQRVLSYHGGKRSLACNLQARQTFCFSYFNIYGVFDDITVIVG
ncbi:unnamed protein product [Linum tenue]|uniref:Protein phosphatase n=1 Tax=Linum tenue TaxID=586396 RepID=A0AAV0IPU7_9ROSI|nr:unnamed protein product [Linum tenue]